MTAPRVMDQVTRTAGFGVRFFDTATGSTVVDGLHVSVYLASDPLTRRSATMNRSGVYVAHTLPGLRAFEFSDAPLDQLWQEPTRPYRVEVRDPADRFLPIVFDADLPARGLFASAWSFITPSASPASPAVNGAPPDAVPLFSTPSRPVPDPLAVVRAQLLGLDGSGATTNAAAWSMLSVSVNGTQRGLGLADARGMVSVLFPFPEPPRRRRMSPPEPRNDFSWLLELSVFATGRPPTVVPPTVADLGDVLLQLGSPRAPLDPGGASGGTLRLTYRQELTVRSASGIGPDDSCLLFRT